MIRIEGLEFAYRGGPFRLSVDELKIETGRKVAFIGPSGSGKTTLLHLIAGIVQPQKGRVRTGGQDLGALSDAARRDFRIRRIGMVFQAFALLHYLDVLDNILLPYRINRSLRLDGKVRERARALADGMEIGDKLARPVERLSQGEQQRVAICRALLGRPDLLLADEPTGNLDPDNKERVLDLLARYADERGATFVCVTHDHNLLHRFDRVIDFSELV